MTVFSLAHSVALEDTLVRCVVLLGLPVLVNIGHHSTHTSTHTHTHTQLHSCQDMLSTQLQNAVIELLSQFISKDFSELDRLKENYDATWQGKYQWCALIENANLKPSYKEWLLSKLLCSESVIISNHLSAQALIKLLRTLTFPGIG